MPKGINNILSKINKKIFVDNKRNTSIVGMISIIIIIAVIFSYEASAIATLDAADELAKLKNKMGSTGPLDEIEKKSATET